ncbi:MAG: hypothetical protein H0U73_06465 [Tatlockia sp.]|nr:hypothetical protein [Tatlockia sp.]
MNRLALITMTAFFAVALSACGDRVEKKVETENVQHTPATTTTTPADTTIITTPSDTKTNQ